MKIIVCENEQEMSRKSGQLFLEQVYKNPDQRRNLAVTAGKTPRIMYELIVPVSSSSRTKTSIIIALMKFRFVNPQPD